MQVEHPTWRELQNISIFMAVGGNSKTCLTLSMLRQLSSKAQNL